MSAKTKGYVITGVIALFVAGAVVWASNNVDAVEDAIG
ncbi:hypothetical protein DFP78_11617 [Photobacterium lutimaris]|nr:hypothetical protein DFP78_11617 [Photobacterium lutimaris]